MSNRRGVVVVQAVGAAHAGGAWWRSDRPTPVDATAVTLGTHRALNPKAPASPRFDDDVDSGDAPTDAPDDVQSDPPPAPERLHDDTAPPATAASAASRGLTLDPQHRSRSEPKPARVFDGMEFSSGIRAVVKDRKPALAACYEEALRHDPSLSGKVVLELHVSQAVGGDGGPGDGDGEVTAASVVEGPGTPFFQACVLQQMVGQAMPSPGAKPVSVRYPLLFADAAETP
jgi:hypothetical protein